MKYCKIHFRIYKNNCCNCKIKNKNKKLTTTELC